MLWIFGRHPGYEAVCDRCVAHDMCGSIIFSLPSLMEVSLEALLRGPPILYMSLSLPPRNRDLLRVPSPIVGQKKIFDPFLPDICGDPLYVLENYIGSPNLM